MEENITNLLQKDQKRNTFLISIFIPLSIVLVMWVVKIVEMLVHIEFYRFGIFPLRVSGLPGVFLSPFIHGDIFHLINNSIPILVLGTALHYFYKEIALRVWLLSMLMTGVWVWLFARDSYHIGASGVVYSLALFVFVSGAIRRHPRLMAISLLVVFLYGSMVWGIFPIRERVSWESHLMGAVSGIVLAIFFRKEGLQRKVYDFELEDDEDDDEFEGSNGDEFNVNNPSSRGGNYFSNPDFS